MFMRCAAGGYEGNNVAGEDESGDWKGATVKRCDAASAQMSCSGGTDIVAWGWGQYAPATRESRP
jgi:hypothetical protein